MRGGGGRIHSELMCKCVCVGGGGGGMCGCRCMDVCMWVFGCCVYEALCVGV